MNESIEKIDHYIATLPAWQANNLATFRTLAHEEAPDIEEAWKWNVPMFLLKGRMIFGMSAFKEHTKYNFILNGASLIDSDSLFNNGFDAKNSRSIDRREGVEINQDQLRALIRKSLDQLT